METRPAYFRAAIHLLCRRHRVSRFARSRGEKTRQPVQSQKIQRRGNLLRQSAGEVRSGVDGAVVVATGLWPILPSTAHGPWLHQTQLDSDVLDAALLGRGGFPRHNSRWFFCSRHPHELIEIEPTATLGSHFSKFDLVPAVHPIYLIAFLSDTHRFPRDYAMDDLFVFGPWPVSHSAATPIDSVPNVIIGVGALFEVEKRARIAGEYRGDVLQCTRITDLSNSLAKRLQGFTRNRTHAQRTSITHFPKRLIDVRYKWVSA